MVKIPQCKEDRKKDDFDKYVAKFVEGNSNEIYVKYPYQTEAQVLNFEDLKDVYNIWTDPATGKMSVKKKK